MADTVRSMVTYTDKRCNVIHKVAVLYSKVLVSLQTELHVMF